VLKAFLPNYRWEKDVKPGDGAEEKNDIFKVNIMKRTYGFKFITAKRVNVKELCYVNKNTMQLESISKKLESVEDLSLSFKLLSDHSTLLNTLFQHTPSLASLTLSLDNEKGLPTKITLISFITSLPGLPSLPALTSLSLNSP
jgi:hypothetical protein